MNVHVICMNDSIEFAVVGDEEKAKQKMAELKASYLKQWRHMGRTEEDHRAICYRHIHTVPGIAD